MERESDSPQWILLSLQTEYKRRKNYMALNSAEHQIHRQSSYSYYCTFYDTGPTQKGQKVRRKEYTK